MTRPVDPDIRLLQAAADPTRLAILRHLSMAGPVCACDIAAGYAVTQPTVSHHLRVLREAGWVVGERRGTWIWYAIRPDAVHRFQVIASAFDATGSMPPARRLPVVQPSA